MKKVLLATTALVASAGWASADVSLSGSAEMGVIGGDSSSFSLTIYTVASSVTSVTGGASASSIETQFHTDIDVNFSMSGETDNGISFTASVDLDENGAFGNTTQGGETIGISAGGFSLTMGDTDGAFDAALTEVGFAGAINDDHTTHIGYSGNSGFDGTFDGQIARASFSLGDFTVHASAEIDDTGSFDPVVGVGASWSGDMGGMSVGVGIGYQTRDAGAAAALNTPPPAISSPLDNQESIVGVSLSLGMDNGFDVVVNYTQGSAISGIAGLADATHMGIGIGYSMNQITIGANWGQWQDYAGAAGIDVDGWGLAVDYDLGGGAEVQFGYGSSDFGGGVTANTWSLGVAMSF